VREYIERMRALVRLAVVLALAASVPAATHVAAAASTPRCTTSGLVVWLNTQGDGAAGSTYYKLQLTNLSGNACTVQGFPGVSAVGLADGQVGRPAREITRAQRGRSASRTTGRPWPSSGS
jgi:Domain of unknown function (DUF4232)